MKHRTNFLLWYNRDQHSAYEYYVDSMLESFQLGKVGLKLATESKTYKYSLQLQNKMIVIIVASNSIL